MINKEGKFLVLLVCVACAKEKPVVGTWELVNSDIKGENILELKEDGSGSVRGGESKKEYAVQWTRDGEKKKGKKIRNIIKRKK